MAAESLLAKAENDVKKRKGNNSATSSLPALKSLT